MTETSPANRIETVIRAATRRRTLTAAVEQSALALSLMFGGGIVLLLVGTQILNWYWLVLLGGVGAGISFLRIWRSRIGPYQVAQLLDQRFGLSDSLSTAWFLSSNAAQRDSSLARFQIGRAEDLAQTVQPAEAFPFRRQRAWAITGALAAAAFGLFAVRYMVTSSLSLRQSLIPIPIESIFARTAEMRPSTARRALNSEGQPNAKLLSPLVRENAPNGDATQPLDPKQSNAEGTSSSSTPGQKTDAKGNSKTQQGSSPGHEGERSGSEAKSDGKAEESPAQKSGSEATRDAKDQSARSQDGSQGLMDKMKDAVSSLMAKMRPSQNSQGTPQDSKNQKGDGKTGDPKAAAKDQAGQQQNASNQQSSQDQNASGQAQGDTKEKAQSSQGQSSDSSPQSGSDSKSGVGSQDGDKGLKEANQLQAMGKLEEIIGKRSADLTGEMTVETTSKKQQLKTEYSQRQGHHSDSGGEINRNEIPLMYQQYVREYMQQVRKQADSGK